MKKLVPTTLLGVATLAVLGLVGMSTPVVSAAADEAAKREEDTTSIVLMADDDDDDTNDDTERRHGHALRCQRQHQRQHREQLHRGEPRPRRQPR